MEKKFLSLFIFSFVLMLMTLSFASSLSIQTKANYSRGEDFIAKVSGSFEYPLTASEIKFYYENAGNPTSFLFNLSQTDPYDYYVSFPIPVGKSPGVYIISIEGAAYYNGPPSSSSPVDTTVREDFSITDSMAFASVSPAFIISKDYYYNLSVTNNLGNSITVAYGPPNNQFSNVTLGPYETKIITLPTPSNGTFENILYTYSDETYSSLTYSELNGNSLEVYKNPVSENPSGNSSNTTNETNTTSPSIWDILFGKGNAKTNLTNETNKTNVIPSNASFNKTINGTQNSSANNSNSGTLQTCSEMGFPVCNYSQQCSGSLVNGLDAQCCNGECVAQSSGGSLGTIGWIIIGAVIILLVLFFVFRFSRTRRISSLAYGRIR